MKGISGSTLKIIAIATMFVDHLGATVLKTLMGYYTSAGTSQQAALCSHLYNMSRDIGRLAFPVFCFLIVEGFVHTGNLKKYALRLLMFCIISEVAFDRALKGAWYYPQKQNVYFTLLIGLLVLIGIKYLTCNLTRHLYLAAIPAAAGMWLSSLLKTDYNYKGVFLIALLYVLRSDRLTQCFGGALASAWELPAPLSFLFVYLYNGTRGLKMKYFFYFFYPCHLMLLYFANTGIKLLLEI